MARITPFEEHALRYDAWFEKNKFVYQSELQAVRELIPQGEKGIEIGVGSGRFAVPLGIDTGIDPSAKMRNLARARGIDVRDGIAENIPFNDSYFDYALMVTSICFCDDIGAAFSEVYRVLKPGGSFIVGFIDKESLVGKEYQQHKDESVFYAMADFYSADEVLSCMEQAGFVDFIFRQTIFRKLKEIKETEPVKEGYEEGSFVVIRGRKQ